MDDTTKDYLLDVSFGSISALKEAIRVVNHKHEDKSKRLTPSQKIKHLSDFINNEHDRVMEIYEQCEKTK